MRFVNVSEENEGCREEFPHPRGYILMLHLIAPLVPPIWPPSVFVSLFCHNRRGRLFLFVEDQHIMERKKKNIERDRERESRLGK